VRATLDTNIAIYAFDDVSAKAPVARSTLASADYLSVQVLNEFANVTVRKRGRSWADAAWGVTRLRDSVDEICGVDAVANAEALRLAVRYQLSFYDSLMLAVALAGGARTIFSEDMHDGLVIDDMLRVVNPFRAGAFE